MTRYARRRDDNHAELADALRRLGWDVRDTSNCPSEPGIADLSCTRRGRHAWVECKTPRGRLSAAQRAFRARVLAAGDEYVVLRGIDDVVAWSEGAAP